MPHRIIPFQKEEQGRVKHSGMEWKGMSGNVSKVPRKIPNPGEAFEAMKNGLTWITVFAIGQDSGRMVKAWYDSSSSRRGGR